MLEFIGFAVVAVLLLALLSAVVFTNPDSAEKYHIKEPSRSHDIVRMPMPLYLVRDEDAEADDDDDGSDEDSDDPEEPYEDTDEHSDFNDDDSSIIDRDRKDPRLDDPEYLAIKERYEIWKAVNGKN